MKGNQIPGLLIRGLLTFGLLTFGLLTPGTFLVSCQRPAPAVPADKMVFRLSRESTSLNRDFQNNAQHDYLLRVEAGQFVHLVIDQQGIDVLCRLKNSAGDSLLVVDGFSGSWGAEEIFWLAPETEDLQLTVRAVRKEVDGHYELDIRHWRAARQDDHLRAEAALHFEAGRKLGQQGLQSFQEQIVHYEKVAAIWRQLDNRPQLAKALYQLGHIRANNNEHRAAIKLQEQAATLFAASDIHRMQASSLHLAGKAYYDLGETESARTRFEEALRIRERLNDQRGQAFTLNYLGMVNVILGEYQQALTFYENALTRWRANGERFREGIVLHNRGRCYLYLGQFQQSLDDLSQALKIREMLNDQDRQAKTLNGLGLVYYSLALHPEPGRAMSETHKLLDQALASLKRSLDIGIATENHAGQAVTLSIMGRVHGHMKDYSAALAAFNSAREIFQRLGYHHREAFVLYDISALLVELKKNEEALAYLHRALPLLKATGRQHEIDALAHIAIAEHQRGNLEAAREYIEKAIEKNDSLRIKPISHALRSSFFALRHDYYGLYIDLLMELHLQDATGGYDAQALVVSERARARSQLEALIESGAELRRGADPKLLEREQFLKKQINLKELQRLHLLDEAIYINKDDPIATAELDLRSLLRAYENVQTQIRLSSSTYALLTTPRPVSAQQIQQALDSETLLLHYKLGKRQSYLWVVTRDTISSFVLPKRSILDPLARRVYDLLVISNRRESRLPLLNALNELSEMLLGPIVPLLQHRRLLVVSEGALQYIPFSALPLPTFEETPGIGPAPYETTYMPSASTLLEVQRQTATREQAPGWVAIVADPVFQKHDPRFRSHLTEKFAEVGHRGDSMDLRRFERLIFSEQEAAAILELVPAAKGFQALGFDASRDTVMTGDLGRYRIVHFATHGYVDAEQPELSRLVLSLLDEKSQATDGFLFAHEIYDLDLPTDLVVLSACRTALGKEIRGEGLVGLTQAFMYAGAERVLVSLWPVNDQATAELMARFYRYLLKDNHAPGEALHRAQQDIAEEKRWQAPYYWAGFVLQGGD